MVELIESREVLNGFDKQSNRIFFKNYFSRRLSVRDSEWTNIVPNNIPFVQPERCLVKTICQFSLEGLL